MEEKEKNRQYVALESRVKRQKNLTKIAKSQTKNYKRIMRISPQTAVTINLIRL